MNVNLVVTRAFGTHAKGDLLTDQATVAAILAGEYASHVVRVMSQAAPATPAQEH